MDWFRSIIGGEENPASAQWYAEEIQQLDADRGEKIKPWIFQGYKGWRSPTLRWGVRDWRFLWETSGQAAPSIWRHMARYGGRVTRLDLQATLRLSEPQPTFGTRCFYHSQQRGTTRARRRTVSGLTTETTGLWFGRVGSRTSERYFRLYDKGIESRSDPMGVRWRLELEAKRGLAQALSEELCATPNEPKLCYERLVSSWKQEGFSWPVPGRPASLPPVARPAKREQPSLALALWIQSSVRPVIERAGKVFTTWELLQMLGLESKAVPILPPDADGGRAGDD